MFDQLVPLAGDMEPVEHGGMDMPANDVEAPDAPEENRKHVSEWMAKIDESISYHKDKFEIISENRKFAKGIQWPGQTENDDRYVCDITQAWVRRRVNSLYAKNPSVVAKIHEQMDFEIWDETEETLQAALADPMNPFNQMLIDDIRKGMARRVFLHKLGKTLEIVIRNQIRKQQPNFKREMKRFIRREEIDGVAFLKLDFVRESQINPDVEQKIGSVNERLAYIHRLTEEQQESGNYECPADCRDPKAEQKKLEIALQTLHEQKYIMKNEGMLFAFPKTENVIIDMNCIQLEGFVGAEWIAERVWLTNSKIEEIYGCDVSGESEESNSSNRDKGWSLRNINTEKQRLGKPKNARECFIVWDKNTGSTFTICRGYDDYLRAPAAPDIFTPQFFPYYAMAFNQTEDEDTIYPRATVRMIMHQQKEYNRKGEAIRQHRIAERPLYGSVHGALDEEDKDNLAHHEAHDVLELKALQPGQKVDDILQMIKKAPIDPNVYNTNDTFGDIGKIVGAAPSSLSTTSDGTATEATIAEASNQSDSMSNADDQDDFLSQLMNDLGHNCMLHMSMESVKAIAGPGAVWPNSPDEALIEDVYCDIVAGSSGRPNRAAEGAALQRLYPLLLQIPGMKPEWLARKATRIIDDNVDLTDAWLDGLPSIMAKAQAAQMTGQPPAGPPGSPTPQETGNPETSPAAQGPQGQANAPQGPQGAAPPALPSMPGAAHMADAQAGGGMLARARARLRSLQPGAAGA